MRAHLLEAATGEVFDVAHSDFGRLLGHPVVDGQVVLDFARSDVSRRLTAEVMPGVSVRLGTGLRPFVAVVDLGSVVTKPGGCVTVQSSVAWNFDLVAEAGEVVSKALPHVFNGVDLGVFDPSSVLVGGVDPEREPVGPLSGVGVLNFVVEFELLSTVWSDVEITLVLRVLVNTRIPVDCLSGDLCRDGVGSLMDVRLLHELSVLPVTVAGAVVVVIVVVASVEYLGRVDAVPPGCTN